MCTNTVHIHQYYNLRQCVHTPILQLLTAQCADLPPMEEMKESCSRACLSFPADRAEMEEECGEVLNGTRCSTLHLSIAHCRCLKTDKLKAKLVSTANLRLCQVQADALHILRLLHLLSCTTMAYFSCKVLASTGQIIASVPPHIKPLDWHCKHTHFTSGRAPVKHEVKPGRNHFDPLELLPNVPRVVVDAELRFRRNVQEY